MSIIAEPTTTFVLPSPDDLDTCFRLREEMNASLEEQINALPAHTASRRKHRRSGGTKTRLRTYLTREEHAALMHRGVLPTGLGSKKLTRRQASTVQAVRAELARAKDARQATVAFRI